MRIRKEDLEQRIEDLTNNLKAHYENEKLKNIGESINLSIASLRGEIFGLRWVLLHMEYGYYETNVKYINEKLNK
jgi:hypothetical protein